jgi:ribose-phosphate pyrophosphokinase
VKNRFQNLPFKFNLQRYNSIPHTPERDFPQLTVLSVGNLLGETIWRVHNDTPVSFNSL